MSHPLVDLAHKQYYFKSHINESLITGRTNANDENFKVRANDLVRSIDAYPHAFVLACLMDTGVDADVAWTIPYRVFETLGTFEIHDLYKVSTEQYAEMFNGDKKWHRYPVRNAGFFYDGVHKIVDNEFMSGDASKIWSGKPSSRDVILRFMDFTDNIDHISKFSFYIGGYFGGYNTYVANLSGNKLKFESQHWEISKPVEVFDEDGEPLTKESFLKGIRKLHMGEWKRSYSPKRFGYMVLDGTQWEVEIEYDNGHRNVRFDGDNSYPYNFNDLKVLFGIEEDSEHDEEETNLNLN